MVIIRAELLAEKEEIQNKMLLLLERVFPSGKILMDILEFHTVDHILVYYLPSA